MKIFKVGIAGYGIVGKRRHQFINEHTQLQVIAVCDQSFSNGYEKKDNLDYFDNYLSLLETDLDILFVCMPNNIAAEVTIAGLNKGLHVFCEKPPGMDVQDIRNVIVAEKNNPGLKLKYGFNHRYHESIKEALRIIQSGELGEVINLRGVYGKSNVVPSAIGGWRAHRSMAGGGILLDQGIHMIDFMRLFCGEFEEVKSFISNAYWNHDVEDNAYALLKDAKGRIAMLNSTATQWQHKFNLEITLSQGYIELHGILSGTKSYGEERIVVGKRDTLSANGQMESRTIKFLQDNSWKEEIFEFAELIINDQKVVSGNSNDALQTMKLVFDIYCSDEHWKNQFNITDPKN